MSVSTTYLLNVALHGAVLSIFATGLLALFRRPGRRSFVAISGLLAVGILPWMTALRPERRISEPVAEVQAQPVSPTLPLWTVVTLPMPEEKSVVKNSEPVADARPFVLPDPLTFVVFMWGAGTVAGMLLLAGALLRVWFWKRSLRTPDDKAWQTLASLSPDIPGRHLFLLSESTTSPCVTGFFRPRIVLPRFLLEKEAEQQLRWALGHEVAHLRAGDSRWVIVFSLVRCVNWWNPFIHLLVSRWAEAREQLCDLHATGLSEDRPDYGKFLIDMARRITGRPPLSVTMAKRAHASRLKQRIVSLLESQADSAKPLGKGFIGAGVALFMSCSILVSSLKIGAEEIPELSTEIPETAEEIVAPATAPLPSRAPETTTPARPAEPTGKAPFRQFKMMSKLLVTPGKPTFKDGTLLSDAGVQLYMRSTAAVKGVDLMTMPSLTGLLGQSTDIKIINGVGPSSVDPAPFVGIILRMETKAAGNQVNLRLDADYRFVPGKPLSQFRMEEARNLNPDEIKTVKHSISPNMDPGQTVVCDMGEIERGRFLQLMVSLVSIGPDGRQIEPLVTESSTTRQNPPFDENPPELGPKAKHGKLRLDAVVIDIPRDPTLPEHQRNFKNLMSVSDDSLEALVSHYRLVKRKLTLVEIPLAGRIVPWPEFPGIRLSASASMDLKRVVLVNDSEQNGRSGIGPADSGGMVHIDVQSGNPAIERRVYITVTAMK